MKKLLILSATIVAAFMFFGFLAIGVLHQLSVAYAQVASTTSQGTDGSATSTLQAEIAVNDQQIANLNQQIATYQKEIQQAGANKATLQTAINSLNLQKSKVQAQVAATQSQINVTNLQIQELGVDIASTQQSITAQQTALGAELRILQKSDGQSFLLQLLSSNTLSDAWDNVSGVLEMQEAIQNKMQSLQSQKGTLADSQNASEQEQVTLTSQQQSLASQQQSLTQTEQSKNQLLVQTNAQESQYEQLLAAAEAQLQSFSAFAQNAGGSASVGSETECDSWGCYYNQRDSAWGNNKLNGTQYTMAADGCLVTSMAMVLTHYGYKDVTPETINANPNDFAAYYPAYLLTSFEVDGATATRKTAAIDATLATGNPVIVGINAYGGTHFVVLVSGSKGNYIMKDPYIQDGNDIPFTAHYTLRSIFAIAKVVIAS